MIIIPSNTSASLQSDLYWSRTVFMLKTVPLDGATNGSFTDAGFSSVPLTNVGASQGALSPTVPPGYWSCYFPSSGTNYLSATVTNDQLGLGTGDFTVEAWVNMQNTGTIVSTYGGWWLQHRTDYSGYCFGVGDTFTMTRTYAASPNKWMHIAITRNGTSLRMFFDGVQQGATQSDSSNFTASTTLRIGSLNGSFGFTGGYISNLRVVKGSAVYTANFTPSTTPLTAVPGTVLLACQDDRFKDNGTHNLNLTRTGDVAVSRSTVFQYSPGASGPTTPTSWSAYFDGAGDYLQIPDNAALDLPGDFAIEFWINPEVGSEDLSGILSHRNTSGFTDGVDWAIRMQLSAGKVGFGNSISGSYLDMGTFTYGRWSHHAITRSGTTIRTFKDGNLVYSGTDTNGYSASDVFVIGRNYVSGLYYKGAISNVRVVKGSPVYTANFTPPTSPLTAISGTSLLTLQDSTFKDNSSNNFTVTKYGDTAINPANPFPSVTLDAGYWSSFMDGTGDYLTAPDNAALQMGTGDFTIEMWWLPTTVSGYQTLFDKGYNTAGGILLQTSTTSLVVYGGGTTIITAGTFVANTWHHVAVTRSGTTVRLFINGALVGTGTSSANFNTAHNLGIGSSTNQTGNGFYPATGYFSNVRVVKGSAVYTAAFTPPTSPLAAISGTSLLTCQDSTFKDNSSNAFTMTPYGDVAPSTLSPYVTPLDPATGYWGTYFDGTGDYLTVNSTNAFGFGTGDYTVEAWINPASWTPPNGSQIICGGSSGRFAFRLGAGWTNYLGGLQVTNSMSADYDYCSYTFTPGAWYHVAVTRQSGTVRFFVNGVQQTNSSTGSSGYNWANETQSRIGIASDASYEPYKGFISNLRVVKGTAVYTAAFTPSTTPLTAVGGTTLLACQDGNFVDNSGTSLTVARSGDTIPVRNSPFGTAASTPTGSGYFTGANPSYVRVPANPGLAFGYGDFTVEFWVNPQTASTAVSQIWFGSPGNSDRGGIAVGMRSGAMWWLFGNGSAWVFERNAGTAPATNTWSHIAVTRSGGVAKLFVNGALIDSIADTTNLGQGTYWQIGQYATGYNLTGHIADFRVVKGVDIYRSGFVPPTAPPTAIPGTTMLLKFDNAGIYDAARSVDLNVTGTVTSSSTTRKYGSAVNFSGSSPSYLTVSDYNNFTFGLDDFTIEMWLNTRDYTALQFVYDGRPSGDGAWPCLYFASGALNYYVSGGNRISTSAIVNNTWYHLAVCRASGSTRMFLNGTQVGSTWADSTVYLANSVGSKIGGYSATPSSYSFNGYIEDFRITRFARYTTNFTPPSTVLPITAPA